MRFFDCASGEDDRFLATGAEPGSSQRFVVADGSSIAHEPNGTRYVVPSTTRGHLGVATRPQWWEVVRGPVDDGADRFRFLGLGSDRCQG